MVGGGEWGDFCFVQSLLGVEEEVCRDPDGPVLVGEEGLEGAFQEAGSGLV